MEVLLNRRCKFPVVQLSILPLATKILRHALRLRKIPSQDVTGKTYAIGGMADIVKV